MAAPLGLAMAMGDRECLNVECLNVVLASGTVSLRIHAAPSRRCVWLRAWATAGFAITPLGHWHGRECEVMVKHLGLSPLEAISCATYQVGSAQQLRLITRSDITTAWQWRVNPRGRTQGAHAAFVASWPAPPSLPCTLNRTRSHAGRKRSHVVAGRAVLAVA